MELCHWLFFWCHLLLSRCFGAFQAGSLSWWSNSPPNFNFNQPVTGHSGERGVRRHLGGKGSERTLEGKGSERTLGGKGQWKDIWGKGRWKAFSELIQFLQGDYYRWKPYISSYQVIKINRTPIFILNLLIPYCCSGSWYLESGQHHLLLVDPGSHLAFRQAF